MCVITQTGIYAHKRSFCMFGEQRLLLCLVAIHGIFFDEFNSMIIQSQANSLNQKHNPLQAKAST